MNWDRIKDLLTYLTVILLWICWIPAVCMTHNVCDIEGLTATVAIAWPFMAATLNYCMLIE
jgi:hypothetical protein